MNLDPKRVEIYASRLEQLAIKYPNGPVNMISTVMDMHHPCKTPGCHAGWGYLAIHDLLPLHKEFYDIEGGFGVATDMLSRYLLNDEKAMCDDLRDFFKDNNKIWGNKNGYYMFSAHTAFVNYGPVTINDIASRWRYVSNQLGAVESTESIKSKEISRTVESSEISKANTIIADWWFRETETLFKGVAEPNMKAKSKSKTKVKT